MNLEDYAPLLTAEAFIEIDFGERIKAELENGIIYPQVRGPVDRVTVTGNMLGLLHDGARGTGFSTFGSLFAVTTGHRSVRYPDVSVFGPHRRGPEWKESMTFDDPVVAVHVMPTDDRRWDRLLGEYGAIASMNTLLLIDWECKRVLVAQRRANRRWHVEEDHRGDVDVPALALTMPRAEIFARD